MTRGNAQTIKVHYKGQTDDFLVFIDDVEAFKKYKSEKEGEKTTPLAQVVSSFQVFTTGNHGAQGSYNTPSDATLENEFGKGTKVEDAIKVILAKGEMQEGEFPERQGRRNDTQGAY
ncbi:ribosome maturation protein [Coniochaeta sp. 2T2.1]|nr:ribosome maturation protein [Coniochaeta sp. 2T2.1]